MTIAAPRNRRVFPIVPALTVTPSTATVPIVQGSTGVVTLVVARTGTSGDVTLSIGALAAGVTATFAPAGGSGSAFTLTFTTTGATPAGFTRYTITANITGATPGTTALDTNVAAPASYSIAASAFPSSVTLAPSATVNTTVTVTRGGGYTGVVTPSVSALPSGVTAVWTPTSGTGTSFVLALTATSGATVGAVTLTITVSGAVVSNATCSLGLAVASSSGIPTPGVGATLLIDSRAGGPQSIQSATDLASATIAFNAANYTEYLNIDFTADVDGAGTRAWRYNWPMWSGTQADSTIILRPSLPSAATVTHMFVQFKHRMGRTTTGGGNGSVGQFAITNVNCVPSNAAHKFLLIPRRDGVGGGDERLDFLYAGTNTTVAGDPRPADLEFSNPRVFNDIYGVPRSTYAPESKIGVTYTVTFELQTASTRTAADGIVRIWIDGTKVFDNPAIKISEFAFDRFELLPIMNSPQYDMTEYLWDFLVWAP